MAKLKHAQETAPEGVALGPGVPQDAHGIPPVPYRGLRGHGRTQCCSEVVGGLAFLNLALGWGGVDAGSD